MKTWTETLTVAALAATLTLAGCAEDGPGSMIEADAPVPGDPAIYAPDGWPLQIGDVLAPGQELQLQRDFLRYGNITAIHLVGDQVYGARYGVNETGNRIYEGHFPEAAMPYGGLSAPENEHRLPPEFHGKIEYYPPPIEHWYTNAHGEHRVRIEIPPSWERIREEMRRR